MELVRPEGEEWPKAEATDSVGCPDTGPGLNRPKKDNAGVPSHLTVVTRRVLTG